MQSINVISNDNWDICFRNIVRVMKYRVHDTDFLIRLLPSTHFLGLCLNSPHGVIGQGNLAAPLATSSTWDRHRQHFPMSSRSIQHKYSQNKHPTVATKQRLGSNQHKNLHLTVATKQKLRPNQHKNSHLTVATKQ